MAVKKNKAAEDTSTEEKIKNAARKVFHQKGFAATRTRDIAEEAKINLALLNYYFRSKKKLFDIIMLESLQQFLQSLSGVFNDENTSLESKFEKLVSGYIDLFIAEPDIPLFVLSELKQNADELVSKMNIKQFLLNSYFMQQIKEGIQKGELAPINPLHFVINMMSMTVFPFAARPLLKNIGNMKQEDFNALMIQRKAMIPKWLKAMMAAK